MIKIMNILENHDRKYNIKIDVKNRKLLEKSNLLNSIPGNINIIIPRESYIRDFMGLFIKKYGSVEGYFESIGVSKENVERIKKKLSV